jgi:hypothetical protein
MWRSGWITLNPRAGGVYGSGNFTMSGGTISGNTTPSGGGAYVNSGGFTMTGGTVSGNKTGDRGGGVFVDVGGSFAMYDGTISGNTVPFNAYDHGGGGVIVFGTFAMYDGTISGNTSYYPGGGVYVSYNSSQNTTFTKTGGII